MPERVISRITADRTAYIRAHLIMALTGAAGVTLVLIWLGNPHIWVGFVAAPAAIAARGFYLAPEALSDAWELTDRSLTPPRGSPIPLAEITRTRSLGSAVQVITRSGDKHLIRYLAAPAATVEQIEKARA